MIAGNYFITVTFNIFRLALGITGPRNKVLGQEFSGTVTEIGAGVKDFSVGDLVMGTNDTNLGAHAEYLCMDANFAVIKKHEKVDIQEAAGIAFGGLTSLYFLRDVAKLEKGSRIAIVGASGCLGTYAVQLAKYYGAHVTAICSDKNSQLVKDLGADDVIDYHKTDFTKGSTKFDCIFNTVGKGLKYSDAKKVLQKNGMLMTAVFKSWSDLRKIIWNGLVGEKPAYKLGTPSIGKDSKADLEFLSQLIAEGKLKVVIDSKVPFENISEAFRLVDSGRKKGNVIVTIAKDL